jgi:energy-coupling factor transporter ATP-binding protein EcfA2
MSQDALARLREGNSLAQTLTFEQLEDYHVAFDDIAGTAGVESNLRYWSSRRGRVALVGESGAGKSSILAAELGAFSESVPESLVPVRVPVALAGPAEVNEVAEFGRHIVRYVLRWAAPEALSDRDQARIGELTADVEKRTGRRRRAGFGLGISQLLPFSPDLSADLTGAATDFEERLRSGEVVIAMKRMVAMFRARGLEPFLIFDDTDAWLQFPGREEEARERAEGFFGNNVRMLTRELDCGFALAVHRSYLALPSYQALADSLEHIEVPRFAEPAGALGTILQKRMDVDQLGIGVADAFSGEALAELGSLYEELPDLRRIMGIAGLAVRKAFDDDEAEIVTAEAISLARAERDPLRGY